MGPDRVDAPAQVVGPAGPERIDQVARPGTLIGLLDQRGCRTVRSGQAVVASRHQRLEIGDQALPRLDEHLAGVGQALVPDVERRGHLLVDATAGLPQQGRPLAQHPIGLVGGPGPFGVEQGERVVEQVASALRRATDDRQVLRREDGARDRRREVLAGRDGLAVDPKRLRPTSTISASTRVGADSPATSARTIALVGVASVVPVRTSASVGAPRKERRVLRYTIASSTLVFPVPF